MTAVAAAFALAVARLTVTAVMVCALVLFAGIAWTEHRAHQEAQR